MGVERILMVQDMRGVTPVAPRLYDAFVCTLGDEARIEGMKPVSYTHLPAVGLVMKKRIGDFVKAGECWCTLHVGAASDLNQARSLMDQALSLSPIRQPAPRLIHAVVDAQGTHYIEG